MPTTMWEARAADGQLEELLAWVLWRVDATAQVYRGAASEPRVVVIDPTGQAERRLGRVPAHLVARPPHSWNFDNARNA
jgi:hypothetical protein